MLSFVRQAVHRCAVRYKSDHHLQESLSRELEEMIHSFDALKIESDATRTPKTIPGRHHHQTHLFVRHYHTSTAARKDTHHLDASGQIQYEIIQERIAFLREHGLLADAIPFGEKLVYQNKHLYKLNDLDELGVSNLERMRMGKCPLDPYGDFITLHHLDQTHQSDLVALTYEFHQRHHLQLHSQVTLAPTLRVHRGRFSREKRRYWKWAADTEHTPEEMARRKFH